MEITVIMDKRRATENGYPILLRFASMGKRSTYALKIWANEDEWDNRTGTLLTTDKKTRLENSRNNAFISKEKARAVELLQTLKLTASDRITPDKFRELFSGGEKREMTFNETARKFIETKNKKNGILYLTTLRKIEKLYGENVRFQDINYEFLTRFNSIMTKEGNKVNGIAIHMRNIRAIVNWAINTDATGQENYAFRKFKIKRQKTNKRALTTEQLQRLFDFKGSNESQRWAIDRAKIIFYLIGINMIDLFRLMEAKDGYIEYSRAKTGAPYRIKIEPEAQKIIERRKGKIHLISDAEHFREYDSFKKKLNKHLKQVGEEIGIEGLTTYVLRHTWATIAARLEIPKETISAALGHTSGNITDTYIDFDSSKITKANRKVINFIKQKKETD